MYVSRKAFMESYLSNLDIIFSGEGMDGYEHIYIQLAETEPWEILGEDIRGFDTEDRAFDFVRKMVDQRIEQEPKRTLKEYVREPLKFELINGMVEVSNERGHYLYRACEKVLSLSVKGNDFVVLKENGFVDYYEYGEFLTTISQEAIRAEFVGTDIFITTHEGKKKCVTPPITTY